MKVMLADIEAEALDAAASRLLVQMCVALPAMSPIPQALQDAAEATFKTFENVHSSPVAGCWAPSACIGLGWAGALM